MAGRSSSRKHYNIPHKPNIAKKKTSSHSTRLVSVTHRNPHIALSLNTYTPKVRVLPNHDVDL